MIENQEFSITDGPTVNVQVLVCDYCDNREVLECASIDTWYKVDDIAASSGLNATVFDTTECIISYFSESATPGE